MTNEFTTLVAEVYSPETFRAAAEIWREKLGQHYQQVTTGVGSVLNWAEPASAIMAAEKWLREGRPAGRDEMLKRFGELLDRMLSSGQNLHHPHYIGHQVPASIPLAGLFDAVGAVTNQVMAIYEMGPWSTAVEFALIGRMLEKIGWSAETGSGLLTHGGSLANLTALLTARNVSLARSWEDGVPANALLVTHTDTHYCVTRSAGILGLGTRQVVKVATDKDRRMSADDLNRVLTEAEQSNRTVIAVSACACATPTGAFDPLEAIADVCERHGVWLHVDAAHGGATLMSRRHRQKLAGLERADSVVWDAHKMLFVPALCAAVLYKSREHRFETFRQNAPYLFDPSAPGMAEYDSGMRTIECTKRAVGFGLWGIWSLAGDELFEQLVDHTFAMAATLHSLLSDAHDFEPLHVPECNILAFRHIPEHIRSAPLDVVNRFQRELRSRLIKSGRFYIVQTQLGELAALRVTVMNPLTTVDDFHELLEELRRTGKQLTNL